jgi:hypothetical protein
MDATSAAKATAPAVAGLASYFMLDMGTYAKGNELGFEGLDFYVCGRGGALGDVHGDVVSAAFVFWTPTTVVDAWEKGRQVMSPGEAATHFADVSHTWAESHLTADVDLVRTADLLDTMLTGARSSAAPLFAAWRVQPEPNPSRPAALVLHRMNVLRELRGGLHGAAMIGHGLDPHVAVSIGGPVMLGLYGYEGPHPDAEDPATQAVWAAAAEAGEIALGAAAFAVLDESERDELVELLTALFAPFAS